MKKNLKFRFAILGIAALTLTNCEKESADQEITVEETLDQTTAEVYPHNFTEKTTTKKFFGTETAFNVVDDYLVLGDMLMSPETVEETNQLSKGTILNNSSRRWNKSGSVYIVPYVIDANLPNKSRVTNAINHWRNNTKIRLVPRTNQKDYVYFTDDGGCYSYIGKIGGRQTISVGSGCSTGNTIHEIGHAIGMFHEQSHPKRDNYVTVNFQNITAGREGNFSKQSASNVKTSTFNLGSIMMYGSYFFSKNGKPTIVRKNGSTFNVQRNGLSSRDKTAISKIYP